MNPVESTDAADTVVDLMQMFRDKKIVFGKASELLSKLIEASKTVKVRNPLTHSLPSILLSLLS